MTSAVSPSRTKLLRPLSVTLSATDDVAVVRQSRYRPVPVGLDERDGRAPGARCQRRQQFVLHRFVTAREQRRNRQTHGRQIRHTRQRPAEFLEDRQLHRTAVTGTAEFLRYGQARQAQFVGHAAPKHIVEAGVGLHHLADPARITKGLKEIPEHGTEFVDVRRGDGDAHRANTVQALTPGAP